MKNWLVGKLGNKPQNADQRSASDEIAALPLIADVDATAGYSRHPELDHLSKHLCQGCRLQLDLLRQALAADTCALLWADPAQQRQFLYAYSTTSDYDGNGYYNTPSTPIEILRLNI